MSIGGNEKPLEEYNPKEIEIALRNVKLKLTPDILAKWRRVLAAEWGWIAGQLEPILRVYPDAWIELRAGVGSDKKADMEWARTDDGKNETILKLQLKKYEKLISSLNQEAEMSSREWGGYGGG
jgi:hypothetical protein